jgi:hypothetical protein
VAERLRDEHQARLDARSERTAVQDTPAAGKAQSLEEIRREARENWLRMRSARTESAARVAAERTRDEGLEQ